LPAEDFAAAPLFYPRARDFGPSSSSNTCWCYDPASAALFRAANLLF